MKKSFFIALSILLISIPCFSAQQSKAAKSDSEIQKLIKDLKYGTADAKANAAEALGKIGPAAKDAVSALSEALKDKEKDVRWRATYALGEIGPSAKAAVPALIEALKDEDADVRGDAAYALGNIGPAAKDAVPALIETLKDEDKYVRGDAARALGNIGDKSALEALTYVAENDSVKDVRNVAKKQLPKLNPE